MVAILFNWCDVAGELVIGRDGKFESLVMDKHFVVGQSVGVVLEFDMLCRRIKVDDQGGNIESFEPDVFLLHAEVNNTIANYWKEGFLISKSH